MKKCLFSLAVSFGFILIAGCSGSGGGGLGSGGPPQFTLSNPSQDPSSRFGAEVRTLPVNGNIVVTDPVLTVKGVTRAGAVYLFNGHTGALISTLTGTATDEAVGGGGIGVLATGNFVVFSNFGKVDSNHLGYSATFVNGASGLNGTVSIANSLVQSLPSGSSISIPCTTGQPALPQVTCQGILRDSVTIDPSTSALSAQGSSMRYTNIAVTPLVNENFTFIPLANGNYLVLSPGSGSGGAVTFGNGTTGISGVVSAANSLIGSTGGDIVGAVESVFTPMSVLSGTTVFANGNYFVKSYGGPITFGSKTSGAVGTIPTANSLQASTVIELANGNYVVPTSGGITLVDGTTLAPINTLTGGGNVTPLTNGNYVVSTPSFNGGVGAVTFVNGKTGLNASVSAANSLVGASAGDSVGTGVVALSNGNYVVRSPLFGGGVGAVTLGDGTNGSVGVVGTSNSLVGAVATDKIGSGGVTALTNGNYVVQSPLFGGGVGAVTLGDGMNGTVGIVGASNSLVGATTTDAIGSGGATALTNGNYVVFSPAFGGGVRAVTFGNGINGIAGTVSAANSLVGTQASDSLASGGIIALSSGGYVVVSPNWANGGTTGAGAVTFGSASNGVVGTISAANSLVGSHVNDHIGNGEFHDESGAPTYPLNTGNILNIVDLKGVIPLTNGNYVVMSPDFSAGNGAATFGNGTTGVVGAVTSSNSLVGTVGSDHVSGGGVVALPNSNFVVLSPLWSNGALFAAGAVTFGNGNSGVMGMVSASNSLVGANAGDFIGFTGFNFWTTPPGTSAPGPNTYQTLFNQSGGTGDSVADLGQFGIGAGTSILWGKLTLLSNGGYVVMSPYFNGESGAVTLASGTKGITGIVSTANSTLGTISRGYFGASVQDNVAVGNVVVSGLPEMSRSATIVVGR